MIRKKIKKEKWDDFLEMAIKNAEKYIDFEKVRPLSNRVKHLKRKPA